MTSPSTLPELKREQRVASDPRRHVWLSASAGTGKTQVLSARVFRLLLRGVDPGAILCLTFTKAGAAEMASRINGRLAQWVRMAEPDLRKDLFALGEDAADDALVARARTLFARVLDAPGGGLRIQTIHSFCQSLLSAFPVEAGLVPGFRPLEPREEAVLAREALSDLLLQEEREGRTRLVDAIGALSRRLGEGSAESFLLACAKAPAAMEALPSGIQPFLRRALDLPMGDIEAEIERCCGEGFDCATLERIAEANRIWGTKGGLSRAEIVIGWLAQGPAERAAGLAGLHLVWAKSDGELRSFGKGKAPQDDWYAEAATALHGRCAELLAMRDRAAYADCLAEALEAGRAYARVYAEAKRRRGAVDFDDLIQTAVRLLETPGMGDWVRYKLDQTTDHVLIDEAQDTNRPQWAIVRAIAEEFFRGEGAHGQVLRTLFTVGDYKQAIFGFQGTNPLFFAEAHRHFQRLAAAVPEYETGRRPFDTLSLTHSFRSTRPILEFVDAAIRALPDPGMGLLSEVEEHRSEVPGAGSVTLWPPVTEGAAEGDEEEWIDDATRKLAGDIARRVKEWLADESMCLRSGRRLRPEDVMILVKRRGELASLIVARLYAEGVPVAGVDRLRLNAPLAVQDLLAAIRFVLQPDDDLSLASLLVSPLIGWSQEELMEAALRERGSLWRHLRATQPAERLAPLNAMLARADIATPYRFLEELLSGELDGRRMLLRRLGEEARDPIEELLTAALDFERVATPSLQRFLDWFDRGDVEIVRDPSQPLDAVRVMTAHGAKGLQAPLVILADATADPGKTPRSFLTWAPEGFDGPAFPIFRPRSAERGGPLEPVVEAADARELEEHWRLFYVAATRAEERLVIAGALPARAAGKPPEKSWYAASVRAFDALGVPAGEGERVFSGTAPTAPARPREERREEAALPPVPEWLRRPAPAEARPPRPLAPSSIGDDQVSDPPPGPAMREAAARGKLLHGLFERLPPLAADQRRTAGLRWLMGSGGVRERNDAETILADACAVIEDPRFAALFAPDALAEAPVAAVVEGNVISGTIDRLVVSADRVAFVDFKTGRRVPPSLEGIPDYHLRQMAAYGAALAVIFPGRAIEATLLYTAGPTAFVLPQELLARYKPGYGQAEQSLASGA